MSDNIQFLTNIRDFRNIEITGSFLPVEGSILLTYKYTRFGDGAGQWQMNYTLTVSSVNYSGNFYCDFNSEDAGTVIYMWAKVRKEILARLNINLGVNLPVYTAPIMKYELVDVNNIVTNYQEPLPFSRKTSICNTIKIKEQEVLKNIGIVI